MKLGLTLDSKYDYSRRWVVGRRCPHATKDQHAHFKTKKDALIFIEMIDWQIAPRTEEYQVAIRRVCNRKELIDLNQSNAKYRTFLNFIDRKYNKKNKNHKPKYYNASYCNV